MRRIVELVEQYLVASVIGGLVCVSIVLAIQGVFVANFPHIVWLAVSVTLLVCVGLAVQFAVSRLSTNLLRNGMWEFIGKLVVLFLTFLGALLVLIIIMDWSVGSSVRSLPAVRTIVPRGDLLIGGWISTFYLVLFGLLALRAYLPRTKYGGRRKAETASAEQSAVTT